MPAKAALPAVSIAVNAALAALLLWLYGGDLSDVLAAQRNEVAALSALPSLPVAIVALLGTAAGAALTALGVLTRRGGSWRGYRVMPIVAVVVLFVDLLVVSSGRSAFSSNARALAALDLVEQRATQLSVGSTVPSDPRALEPIIASLGPAPWLSKGQSTPNWSLKMSYGCEGPQLDVGGLSAGTVVYCVDTARSQAWVTLVGLPFEQRFGAPQLVSNQGAPLVALVHPRPSTENEASPRFTEDAGESTLDVP